MRNLLYISILCLAALTSCYREKASNDSLDDSSDTIIADTAVVATKHYGVGYNFIVHRDSICLIAQQPEEHVSQLETDTITIPRNQHLAVMDIRMIPQDSIDSCWVQLISEEGISGWTRENALLPNVVPTDPISQFIMFFSDSHLLIALCILGVLAVIYFMRMAQKRNVPIVHFRDIPSFYPTLLCLIVACSATFYASLQMFGADQWQHFYYHPSLNPFILPPILAIFIASLWAMLIVGIATIEDVRHHLPFEDALIYLAGLAGVCGVLYVIFSISTLYYVGYLLLILYIRFAIKKYQPLHASHYICGNCGKRLYSKGTCPHCGAVNMCLALALTLALGLTGCSSSDDSSHEDLGPNRTIIVYMNAENNLYTYANTDLAEMVTGSNNLPSNCKLLVYIDDLEAPRIYSINKGTSTKVKKYEEMDSSSPTTISIVLNYIIKNYPADEYATVFWGHGTGSQIRSDVSANSLSLPFDEELNEPNAYGLDNNDNLAHKDGTVSPYLTWINVPELAKVLKKLPKQLFIMFDACLMQSVENAYELKDCTDYIIAVACETPTFGANYTKMIPVFGQYAGTNIIQDIVAHYISDNTWGNYYVDRSDGVCISAVKTSEMEGLLMATQNAFSTLTSVSTSASHTYYTEVNSCIYYYIIGYPTFYDIKDVMRVNLSDNNYLAWLTYLEKAIVAKYHPKDVRLLSGDTCPWIPSTLNKENFSRFYLSDERYGGISMFVPKSIYSTTYPNMNKRMYDYEWCQKVGWEQMGWPQ